MYILQNFYQNFFHRTPPATCPVREVAASAGVSVISHNVMILEIYCKASKNLYYDVNTPRGNVGIYKITCIFNYFISIRLSSVFCSYKFYERNVILSFV